MFGSFWSDSLRGGGGGEAGGLFVCHLSSSLYSYESSIVTECSAETFWRKSDTKPRAGAQVSQQFPRKGRTPRIKASRFRIDERSRLKPKRAWIPRYARRFPHLVSAIIGQVSLRK